MFGTEIEKVAAESSSRESSLFLSQPNWLAHNLTKIWTFQDFYCNLLQLRHTQSYQFNSHFPNKPRSAGCPSYFQSHVILVLSKASSTDRPKLFIVGPVSSIVLLQYIASIVYIVCQTLGLVSDVLRVPLICL